ncbi:uncharacterized protein LOC129589515 isoform X2 [Paramacrobiotus metropolitanus]|nr:uncharacterized protein LOC129589515 isoform X2 [Paramacrobiotus metropolitanus]XP_055340282.1 uncharacterized protein LOC129589515 isoform X2 [Paramacrobiotus metropolitanus]
MLCSNRRREFCTFANCFLPTYLSADLLATLYAAAVPRMPVVVLVPETSSGPWIWVLGEMPCHNRGTRHVSYEAAVVHWRDPLTGIPHVDLVPLDRIRCPLFDYPGAYLPGRDKVRAMVQNVLKTRYSGPPADYTDLYPRTCRGQFYLQTVLLEGIPALSAEETSAFITHWNRWEPDNLALGLSNVTIVDLGAGQSKYICKAENHCGKHENRLLNGLRRFHDEWMGMPRNENTALPFDRVLPLELCQEVFSQLDTLTQIRLRLVCTTWNLLTESPALATCIVMQHYVRCPRYPDQHAHGVSSAVLFKCLRPDTRHVVLWDRAAQMNAQDLLKIVDVLPYVAQQNPGSRLTTLYLVGWRMSMLVSHDTDTCTDTPGEPCVQHDPKPRPYRLRRNACRLEDFIRIYGGLPCEALHMINCTLQWSGPSMDSDNGLYAGPILEVTFPRAGLPLNGDFGCALWNACEASMLAPTDAERRTLVQWLTRASDMKNRELLKIVVCKGRWPHKALLRQVRALFIKNCYNSPVNNFKPIKFLF